MLFSYTSREPLLACPLTFLQPWGGGDALRIWCYAAIAFFCRFIYNPSLFFKSVYRRVLGDDALRIWCSAAIASARPVPLQHLYGARRIEGDTIVRDNLQHEMAEQNDIVGNLGGLTQGEAQDALAEGLRQGAQAGAGDPGQLVIPHAAPEVVPALPLDPLLPGRAQLAMQFDIEVALLALPHPVLSASSFEILPWIDED